jgi:polar amino acid transport system substrate-binding protein
LVDNREIQCISTSESGHNLMVQALGYPATDFALPFAVHTDQLYYAFNIETTDEMIMNFQGQLDSLKMNNSGGSSDYEDILDRYARVKEATDGITSEMAINLVDRTALDLQADGPGTLARINQGLAPYKDATNSSLFTYVYDKQAVIIANADDQSLTNISLSGKTDVAGKKYHDEIIKGAIENGTGWVDYIYTRPDQDGLYLRTVYYKMVTASNAVQFVVCCGRMGKRDA